MDRVVNKLSLDLTEARSEYVLRVFTCDAASRTVEATFRMGDKPYPLTGVTSAVFRAKKPSGAYIYNDCSIVGDTVTADITTAVTDTAGEVKCQIMLSSDSGALLSSPIFSIAVSSPVMSEKELEGTNEYSALLSALSEVRAASAPLEPIVSGTLTEETTEIEITKDSDGNSLNLRDRITVYFELPAASPSGSIVTMFNTGYSGFIGAARGTTAKYSRCAYVWNGQVWENYSVSSNTYASNSSVSSIVKYFCYDSNVTVIKFFLDGGFPVGTKYYIYGRRGNS